MQSCTNAYASTSRTTGMCVRNNWIPYGRSGLLKILTEFTLVVEPAVMIFITKWLIECGGNLTGPWTSFGSVRTKLMMNCKLKLDKLLLHLISTVFVASVFTATAHVVWITFLSLADKPTFLPPVWCTKRFEVAMSSYAACNGELNVGD